IPPTGGATPERALGSIDIDHIDFAYPTRPDVPVLRDLALSIERGEIVALVGPSGAGKSTIGSLLSRLYDPQGGRITLDGHDLRTLDPRWLRGEVGAVAQEPVLFSSSIADNIRYGRSTATDDEVREAARAANAHEF